MTHHIGRRREIRKDLGFLYSMGRNGYQSFSLEPEQSLEQRF